MFNRVLVFYLLAWFFAGCAGGLQGLAVLRGYSSEQAQTARQIKVQKNRLRILISDIEKNNIETGMSYKNILHRYGEPVLVWNMEPASSASRKVLYRDPVEYFYTDRVYLYFDNSDNLVKWEYYPALKKIKGDADAEKNS
jgi:hypothetical protein